VPREARDMRERRDTDRLDFRLVSPISLVKPASLGYPAGSCPVVPDMRTMGFQEGRHRFAAVASDRGLGEIGSPTLPIDPPSRPLL